MSICKRGPHIGQLWARGKHGHGHGGNRSLGLIGNAPRERFGRASGQACDPFGSSFGGTAQGGFQLWFSLSSSCDPDPAPIACTHPSIHPHPAPIACTHPSMRFCLVMSQVFRGPFFLENSLWIPVGPKVDRRWGQGNGVDWPLPTEWRQKAVRSQGANRRHQDSSQPKHPPTRTATTELAAKEPVSQPSAPPGQLIASQPVSQPARSASTPTALPS